MLAVVCTLAAQNTVPMFQIVCFDTLPDIDAHRTVPSACFAVYAVFRFCPELEGRPAENVPDLSPEDHEGRDPASVMTESMAAGDYGKDQEDK